MRRARGVVACALVGLLLAGVPSSGGTLRTSGPIVLPFDTYRLTEAEEAVVNRALLVLVTRCMRDHGFSVITIPPAVVGGPSGVPRNSRRYGVTDADTIRRFGYHLPRDPAADDRAAHLDKWIAGLNEQESAALYGTDDRPGCRERAPAMLTGGVPDADVGRFASLRSDGLERSREDPRVLAAIRDWRACMRREGLDYADPYEAVGDERWNLDSPAISDREIEVATADVRCKNQTRLVRIWVTVESEIQRKQIRRNAAMFARLAEVNRLTVANAERVLEDDGGR
jgi:hypothetical protein